MKGVVTVEHVRRKLFEVDIPIMATTVNDRMVTWKQAFARELDEAVSRLEEGNEPPTWKDVDVVAVRLSNSTYWWPKRNPEEEQDV